MAFDPERYPENWAEIARRVKEAASWRCEQCGHPHDPATWHTLTVHHIDGNTWNNADWNLVALCQRCHLSLHQRQQVRQLMFDFYQPVWLHEKNAACQDAQTTKERQKQQ